MTTDRTLVRRYALRALAEGAKPSLDLLAEASGLSPAGLRRLAAREGWALHGTPTAEDFKERVRPVVSKLFDKVEAISLRAAEEDGKIDRTEIDSVLVMIRALEKIAEFEQPEEAAMKKQMKKDEDMAAVLERLNARIVELAGELAAQMVAQHIGSERDPARG